MLGGGIAFLVMKKSKTEPKPKSEFKLEPIPKPKSQALKKSIIPLGPETPQKKMKKCAKCQKECSIDSVFCNSCGYMFKTDFQIPVDKTEIPEKQMSLDELPPAEEPVRPQEPSIPQDVQKTDQQEAPLQIDTSDEQKTHEEEIDFPEEEKTEIITAKRTPIVMLNPKTKIGLVCIQCNTFELRARWIMDNFMCKKCLNRTYNIGYFCKKCNKLYSISKEDFKKFNEPNSLECPVCDFEIVLVKKNE